MNAAGGQSASSSLQPTGSEWSALLSIAGVASLLLLFYSLATIVQLLVLGGQPNTATEAFRLLQESRLIGLLRLDFPTVLALPLYYLVFLGLFAALRNASGALTTLATSLAFVGVTLILATPTALSMLSLSQKYSAATTDSAKFQFLSAGEAILASDIWHSTGAILGGVLLQTGAVVISLVMLRSGVFSKTIAYLGILTHGLDLAHGIFGLFLPAAGVVFMAMAGPLYPLWFYMVGRRLRQLGGSTRAPAVSG